MTKMIIFFRAFFLIISFLIFVGAEARTLLGNHHELKLKAEISSGYGREPYITPSPPASSPPTKQKIVGRPDHEPAPPSPKHDPGIGQLTTTSPDDEVLIILLPTTTSSEVGGRHDHSLPPPSPKHDPGIGQLTATSPDDEVLIILLPTTTSSEVGGRHGAAPPAPKPADEQHQIIITSTSTTDHMNSNHGAQHLPLQASY